MDEQTRRYLRGRFGDYYRRSEVAGPPDAGAREWGYIPWTAGPDTRMIRHRSLLDLGDFAEFLAQERPQHLYYSAACYDDPGASRMAEKGWRRSDLIFDLDADHLPSVTLGEDSYAQMLAKCKTELQELLDFLERDFGFSELSVVFSGGRGYHVHVRDDAVGALESDQRREIVDYVRGTGLDYESLLSREVVAGSAGRRSPAEKRTLPTGGGWGRRTHDALLELCEALQESEREDALERLQEHDRFGEQRAEAALSAFEANTEAVRAGNVDVHRSLNTLARQVAADVAEQEHAHVDEPVTTDTRRLIRLPGSLHGGSGLCVTPLERAEVENFDPLSDAIPEPFRDHDIAIEITDGGELSLGGETFTLTEGQTRIAEYVAIFLMARGRAEKAKE